MGSLNPESYKMTKELEQKLIDTDDKRTQNGAVAEPPEESISISGELQKLWSLAWPVCISSLLQFFFQFVMMLFAGRLGAKNLAAVSLGNSYFNMVYYFMQGAATSLDTMISQAYGQKKIKLCWVWCKRGMILFVFFASLACALLASGEFIFVKFGLEPDLSHHAGEYLWYLIPGVPAFMYFILLQKYQMCMNVMAPSVWVCAIANVLNLLFCYLSNHWDYGTNGLAVALSLARIILLIMMIVVIKRFHDESAPGAAEQESFVTGINDKEETWNFEELKKMLRLAVAGAFMLG
jgi:MATE family multidrug resistance protein